MADPTCCVDGCSTGGKLARGMCTKHYKRWQVHGDPLASKARPISYCVVEDCDLRVEGHSLCRKHLRRKRKFDSTDLPPKPTTCAVEGCDRRPIGRGWCRKHYNRWHAHGDPLIVLPNPMNLPRPFKPCNVQGCRRRHAAKGMCGRHYYNAWNPGWRRANADKVRAKDQRRRARILASPVNDLTARQWRNIKAAYRHRCAYCGKRRPLTMDHVIPLSKGGSNTASNVVPACRSCNSSKCDRDAPTYQPLLW